VCGIGKIIERRLVAEAGAGEWVTFDQEEIRILPRAKGDYLISRIRTNRGHGIGCYLMTKRLV